jgi:integrase
LSLRFSVKRTDPERRTCQPISRCKRGNHFPNATQEGLHEDEALIALGKLKRELRQGDTSTSKSERTTVAAYATRWSEEKAERLRPGVAKLYGDVLSDFVLPHLGELYVDAVTRSDVERWVAWAERQTTRKGEPYAKATLQSWWRVLAALLRDAAAELRLPIDPTYRVRPPQSRVSNRREKRTLSVKQLGELLDLIKQYHSPDRYAAVHTLAYTGMRAGELAALHWEDVDEHRGVIRIQRSVWRGHVSPTKTSTPREVALTPQMADVLRRHRIWLVKSQRRGIEKGIVFPSKRGTYRVSSSLDKCMKEAARDAGIDVSVSAQVLRRTFNTLMVQAGVDRIVLRAQMGHCSEEMTERYAGISIQAKQAAVRQLVDLTEESK